MHTTPQSALTPSGVARLLARAIRATYSSDYQPTELENLVDHLNTLAFSRSRDANLPEQTADAVRQAQGDAAWLDALAGELEGAFRSANNIHTT